MKLQEKELTLEGKVFTAIVVDGYVDPTTEEVGEGLILKDLLETEVYQWIVDLAEETEESTLYDAIVKGTLANGAKAINALGGLIKTEEALIQVYAFMQVNHNLVEEVVKLKLAGAGAGGLQASDLAPVKKDAADALKKVKDLESRIAALEKAGE